MRERVKRRSDYRLFKRDIYYNSFKIPEKRKKLEYNNKPIKY